MLKRILILCLSLPFYLDAVAQGTYEEYLRSRNEEYRTYRNKTQQEFEAYRNKINAEYTQFMREHWREYQGQAALPIPDQKPPVPPTVAPEEDRNRPAIDRPVEIDKIIKQPISPISSPKPIVRLDKEPQQLPVVIPPTPRKEATPPTSPKRDTPLTPAKPQEKPEVKPTKPTPEKPKEVQPTPPTDTRFAFSFYGTDCRVRLDNKQKFTLKDTKENAVADVWERLCSEAPYADMVADCLRLKEALNLCDWAYLKLAETIGNAFLGNNSNEATLLQAYILNQSGYRIRLARGTDSRLYLLAASDYTIYGKQFFTLDGTRFYLLQNYKSSRMNIFDRTFPNDCALSLAVPSLPHFAEPAAPKSRTLTAKRYPAATATVSSNKNLMDFFTDYPASAVNNNENTKWSTFADIPLSEANRRALYPALKKVIAGKSEQEAANIIINFVQTAFVYEYDNKVWGRDRVFAADETLFYPYSDCEDRSILFTRLVRDLMGLETALIYYPGHLATAVRFNEEIPGDYFVVGGKRYLVCDPTFIGANIGRTMTGMDNGKAQVILLDR